MIRVEHHRHEHRNHRETSRKESRAEPLMANTSREVLRSKSPQTSSHDASSRDDAKKLDIPSQDESTLSPIEVSQEEQVKKQPVRVILSLDNCVLPQEILSRPTPSMRDGLSAQDEIDLRILGCELIQSSGILLRLPQVAMATGQVIFQRFYFMKSFVEHSMEDYSMACVALASKIEEAPRRLRDVINVFTHLKQKRLGQPIKAMNLFDKEVMNCYAKLKKQVIKAEGELLKHLGFCVHIKHPHKVSWSFLNSFLY